MLPPPLLTTSLGAALDFSGLISQLLNGLASASSLFLVAAGLSLIFGVTRVVNFAHGSFFMLGLYVAYTVVSQLSHLFQGGWTFWIGNLLASLIIGLLGVVVEIFLLRRIYKSPEIFQLLGTFALVLIIKDLTLFVWGAEDLLGPRAAGLGGAVNIMGRLFPTYDLFLIALGPAVLGILWWIIRKTRFGTLIRAASQDKEMVGALGVEQDKLFTAVFFLGCLLAGLAGALQLPREPASLNLDLTSVSDAFVVVVVGGLGSIPGAYAAALMIAEIKALCIFAGTAEIAGFTVSFSKLTLVSEFLVMAVVLMLRPWGLMGKPQGTTRVNNYTEQPYRSGSRRTQIVWCIFIFFLASVPALTQKFPYTTVLGIDLLIAVLFASSLHFIMGLGGMHSFGHAAFFGLGGYIAALLYINYEVPLEGALFLAPGLTAVFAMIMGWFCVRLSGVYLAMLTLAFAQILWSICYQWDGLTGGSNGMTGIWPREFFSSTSNFYYLTLSAVVASVFFIRKVIFSPFGYSLRSVRDSVLRAQAIGISAPLFQWAAFVFSAFFAGLAGVLYVFSKGGISPDSLGISKSVDGLVMVLLGGLQTVIGPLVGAVSLTWLQDNIVRTTDYWRACLGGVILILVLVFPKGIAGSLADINALIFRAPKPNSQTPTEETV